MRTSRAANRPARLKARDNEPPGSPPDVDQLFGGETRFGTQVGEVALRGARSDGHQVGRVWDRPAGRDIRGKDVQLACRRWPRQCAAQMPRPHARCLAATAMRRRMAHGAGETAHRGGSFAFRWASWAVWAGPGVEGRLACHDLPMRHVSPSCHGDAAGPVGASRDRTEGLGDAIRNYDPSGGTGRLKSSRPDQTQQSSTEARRRAAKRRRDRAR